MLISKKIQKKFAQWMGNGFFASSDIEPGEQLMNIAEQYFISAELYYQFYQFNDIKCQDKISNKMMFAYYLGAVSQIAANDYLQEYGKIHEYIDKLPGEMNGLVCWSEQELDRLDNRELVDKVKEKQRQIYEEYRLIRANVERVWQSPKQNWQYRLFSTYSQIQLVTYQLIKYFYSVIESRSVHYPNTQEVGALVPYLQLFNHSGIAQCQVQYQSSYIVKSIVKITKGQQIFVNYGRYNDEHFLELYGFLPKVEFIICNNNGDDDNYREKLTEQYNKMYRKKIVEKGENGIQGV